MFGSGGTTSKPLFGVSSAATNKPLFGSATTTSGSWFGSTNTGPAFGSTLFGSSSGAPVLGQTAQNTASTPLFSFAGAPRPAQNAPSQFNFASSSAAQQQQLQRQQGPLQNFPVNPEVLARSLTSPELYGDERDGTVAKLNQIQAFCGLGKGYVKAGINPYEYTPQSPFFRFKAIGFNLKQGGKDTDGLVTFICRRSAGELRSSEQRQAFLDQLFKILGNKPSIHAHIDSVKPLPDNM